MPWNRPFESAATPGEASVTSELNDDDWLSSGIFAKASRSIAVCRLVSLRIRSSASTLTTVDSPPTCSALTLLTEPPS